MRRSTSPSRTPPWKVLLFLSPFIVGLVIFGLYPIGATIWYSFTNFRANSSRPTSFVGLNNYVSLLTHNDDFWLGVRNTLWMVLVLVPARTLFALVAAWSISRVKRGAALYRAFFFVPSIVPVVASALSFIVMFNPSGPVNAVLSWFGIQGPTWFNDPMWSKPTLVLMALWACGDTIVIFSAAMLDIPQHLYEAADLDGAGAWRQLWHITLPGVRPVILFSALTGLIYTFQYFTEAFVASGSANGLQSANGSIGYPQGSLLFYSTQLYREGFVFFKTGYASAMAVMLFLVVLAATLVFLRAFRAVTQEAA